MCIFMSPLHASCFSSRIVRTQYYTCTYRTTGLKPFVLFFLFSDTSAADERLPLSFSFHHVRKYSDIVNIINATKHDAIIVITARHRPKRLIQRTFFFQDLETFDLEDFKYNSVNMTSYRIVDDESHRVANVLREMERFQRVGQNMLHKSGIIRVIMTLFSSDIITYCLSLIFDDFDFVQTHFINSIWKRVCLN